MRIAMQPPVARRLIAWLLPMTILLEACASGVPPAPVTSLDPTSLAVLQRTLEDQPAALVLASGEVVHSAEGVVMTAETTSWREGERSRSVPTSEICKVLREVRFRGGKGYAWGLLACAPVAHVIANSTKDPLEALGEILLIEGLCPLIGVFVAAVLKEPPDRVVYAAAESCGRSALPSAPSNEAFPKRPPASLSPTAARAATSTRRAAG